MLAVLPTLKYLITEVNSLKPSHKETYFLPMASSLGTVQMMQEIKPVLAIMSSTLKFMTHLETLK
jgi:hypothetical protein